MNNALINFRSRSKLRREERRLRHVAKANLDEGRRLRHIAKANFYYAKQWQLELETMKRMYVELIDTLLKLNEHTACLPPSVIKGNTILRRWAIQPPLRSSVFEALGHAPFIELHKAILHWAKVEIQEDNLFHYAIHFILQTDEGKCVYQFTKEAAATVEMQHILPMISKMLSREWINRVHNK